MSMNVILILAQLYLITLVKIGKVSDDSSVMELLYDLAYYHHGLLKFTFCWFNNQPKLKVWSSSEKSHALNICTIEWTVSIQPRFAFFTFTYNNFHKNQF